MNKELLKSINNAVKEAVEYSTEKYGSANEEKIRNLVYVARMLESKVGCDFVCEIHQPSKNMAHVTIEEKEVTFPDAAVFSELAKAADNVDIYPKTNGNVVVSFGFNGIL